MTKNEELRRILTRAERAFGDESAERELAAEGIVLGDAVEMTGPELLATLDDDEPLPPRVLITVYENSATHRARVEDSLCAFAEEQGIGTWIGGGEGSIGESGFFDVMFEVQDEVVAAAKIAEAVARIFPQLRIEVSTLASE